MKNIIYFLLLGALITFTSCSENEQPLEEEPSLVVGEWYTEAIDISGTKIETKDGESVTTRYDGSTGLNEDAKIIFNDDNTYLREDSYSIMFNLTINWNHSLELTVFPFEFNDGTYNIEGNKINFVSSQPSAPFGPLDPRNSFEWTIMELTENRMVLFMEKQESSNVDGAEIKNNFEITQIFAR
jgi:hypothetical protein